MVRKTTSTPPPASDSHRTPAPPPSTPPSEPPDEGRLRNAGGVDAEAGRNSGRGSEETRQAT